MGLGELGLGEMGLGEMGLNPLFPTLPLVSPKFPHIPLGAGGWPLGYEERKCWANCACK